MTERRTAECPTRKPAFTPIVRRRAGRASRRTTPRPVELLERRQGHPLHPGHHPGQVVGVRRSRGAREKPQLPPMTVVTPCSGEGLADGSQAAGRRSGCGDRRSRAPRRGRRRRCTCGRRRRWGPRPPPGRRRRRRRPGGAGAAGAVEDGAAADQKVEHGVSSRGVGGATGETQHGPGAGEGPHAFGSELDAVARLFPAPEGGPVVHGRGAVGVHEHGARLEAADDVVGHVLVARPDRGAQPERGGVGPLDGLVQSPVAEHGQRRGELLVADDRVARRRPLPRWPATRGSHRRRRPRRAPAAGRWTRAPAASASASIASTRSRAGAGGPGPW